jgi:hypothetical protein
LIYINFFYTSVYDIILSALYRVTRHVEFCYKVFSYVLVFFSVKIMNFILKIIRHFIIILQTSKKFSNTFLFPVYFSLNFFNFPRFLRLRFLRSEACVFSDKFMNFILKIIRHFVIFLKSSNNFSNTFLFPVYFSLNFLHSFLPPRAATGANSFTVPDPASSDSVTVCEINVQTETCVLRILILQANMAK